VCKEVHSIYGIRYCHLVFYKDVKVRAYVHVYTGCIIIIIIIIIITLCSIMIFTIKETISSVMLNDRHE